MTLGRTSSGAIKIKTDSAGGGLRAVECACCGGCGCASVAVSGDLLAVFENMLTYPPCSGCSGYYPPPGYPDLPTCFGRPSDFFSINADGWDFLWDFVGPSQSTFAGARYSAADKCFFADGFNIRPADFTFYNELYIGQIEGCCPTTSTCSEGGQIFINGQAVPAINVIVDENEPLVPPLEFFFP